MKRPVLISIFLVLVIAFTACATQAAEQPTLPNNNETVSEETMVEEKELILSINGSEVSVNWEDNETVSELIAYTKKENIVVNTTVYGGFEQVGSLPQSFSRNDVRMTTEPGDIVLYSGNQIVLFFGSNSWSYTKLGHIEGLSVDELSDLLGESTSKIIIE